MRVNHGQRYTTDDGALVITDFTLSEISARPGPDGFPCWSRDGDVVTVQWGPDSGDRETYRPVL